MKRERSVCTSSNDEQEDAGFQSFLSTDSILSDERDWRKSRTSVRDKLGHILDSDTIPKDITFIVGHPNPERISAHKFILQLSSPVLEELIHTYQPSSTCNDKEDEGDEVDVHFLQDTEPEAFKYLLKYIYTDVINIGAASPKIVISLLRLLKKYEIGDLTDICCQRLKSCISPKDAVLVLDIASEFEHDDLHEFALKFILRNGAEVLESSYFLEISRESVSFILKDDELNASELTVFKAAFRWAQKRCQEGNEGLSPKNIRFIMGEILYLVRFPLMNPDQFMLNVVCKGVLLAEEESEILQYLSVSDAIKPNFVPKLFSCVNRTGLLDHESFPCNIIPEGLPTYILMKNCTLDIVDFLNKCSDLNMKTRKKIETISFQNIKVTNYEDEQALQYIRFPSLKTFHLEVTCATDKEEVKMTDILSKNFGKFLFFTKKAKYYPWPWPLSFIWSLDVNVFLSLNGIIFLNVNHETRSVVINQLGQICMILKGLKATEDIKRLSLALKSSDLEISIKSNLSFVASVEILALHFAHHVLNLAEYLRLFVNLTELTLIRCDYRVIDLNCSIASPERLQKMSIHQAQIGLFHEETSFHALEEIFLWNCLWEESFEDNFVSKFPNLREIHFYNSFVDKSLYGVLNEILKLEYVEKIVVSGYFSGNGVILQKVMKDGSELETAIEEFLSKAGVRLHCQSSFCLMKISSSDRREEFPWVARKLLDNEVTEEMFHRFNYDRFYTDFHAFQIRLQQDQIG